MGIDGYIWVCMGIYGYIWVYIDTFMGYIFGIYGYIWVCMGIYGSVSPGREFALIFVLFFFFLSGCYGQTE